ncbi:MAG: amidase [Hyphomicrobiaceae bacterium]
MANELNYLTIAEASKRIAAGKLSSVDLTEACLARIAAVEDRVSSFILLLADQARAAARAADEEIRKSGPRSPMHGIPIGLKDIYDTAGIATTGHSRRMQGRIPPADSVCTQKLGEAGSILLGKLATHEFATGGPSFDLPWPAARNPWRLDRFPGGSSSGSGSAVACGEVLGAMGSDTGGSIRLPAAFCGTAGIKPTYGRVSKRGVLPLSWTFDNCGPLAWTAEDCAIMLQAVAGYDPQDPCSADVPVPDFRAGINDGVKGLRIGVVRHFYESDRPASKEAVVAMDAAISVLRGLGAEIREVTLPPLADYQACFRIIALAEAFSIHEEDLKSRPQDYGEVFRYRVMPGALVTSADYVAAQRQLRKLVARTLAAFDGVDALVTATTFAGAPVIRSMRSEANFADPPLTPPFNVAQCPAIAICNGYTSDGMPLSMQIAGRPFDEAMVFRVAHAYERETTWRQTRPSLIASPDGAPTAAPAGRATEDYATLARRADLSLPEAQLQALAEAMPHVEAMTRRLPRECDYGDELMNITTLLVEGTDNV